MQILNERTKRVLYAVVQSYINHPDPVGSRYVTKRYEFGLSPATIRNIMADLEEMGYLTQPHTSAGRVPTDLGYRFYVDSLVAERSYYANFDALNELYSKLKSLKDDIEKLLNETTKSLSSLSHYLGLAMSPIPDNTTLKRINIYRYRGKQLAVILFTNEGLIKNKIINIDTDISQKDLNRIANYINTEFSGYTLDEIRVKLLKEMTSEKLKCEGLISRAMKICQEALYFPECSLFISGLPEVLELPDFTDLDKIKELSKAIEDKHTIIKLLNEITNSEGIKVIIGSENTLDELKKLSLVASPCKEGNKSIGVVGIIGPTRMNYAKAMFIVETTAKFISQMLTER